MSTILEADETGALRLPATILPHSAPHRRYIVETEGERVVVSDVGIAEAFWKRSDPESRSKDILNWAANHKGGPGLSDAAIGRDSIYD